MATKKKALQAAAGAAGAGEATYVDDVFSTYLYTGNSSTQTITNGIALADGVGGGTSTEFDGTSDYLSKAYSSNGLASSSKTFTFSAWFYWSGSTSQTIFAHPTFYVSCNQPAGNILTFSGYSDSYATVLGFQTSNALVKNSWNHILMSMDMSNSSNRYVYLNDAVASGTYPNYNDTAIGFGQAGTATISSSSAPFDGKLAHVYFDTTYRDLSTEANRRYFIDSDGGSTSPSTLSALSPSVYIPMTDGYSIGENLGTSGDFTANGSPTIVDSGTEYLSDYGQGGMVWIKDRDQSQDHYLYDTERGATYELNTNNTGGEVAYSTGLTAFNSDGFSLAGGYGNNASGYDFTSWTFRKAPGFFDVVTYTGNDTAGHTISHNLGCVPGMIIVKPTSSTGPWVVYHKNADATAPEDKELQLNATDVAVNGYTTWNRTAPTSTEFTLGTEAKVNGPGITYVAYLFADGDDAAAQIFGTDGDQAVVKCGSYTGGADVSVDVGFEPQWVLTKATGVSQNWTIHDAMRGYTADATGQATLHPNNSDAEDTGFDAALTSTGFRSINSTSGDTYIYIAIRRPMKTPESGTEVFAIDTMSNTDPSFTAGFPVDMSFHRQTTAGPNWAIASRLTGTKVLYTDSTTDESTEGANVWDFMDGWHNYPVTVANWYAWMFKRSPGFFDVVCYEGTGSARTVNHNLGVVPEMMIVKRRSLARGWAVYNQSITATDFLYLNSTDAKGTDSSYWNNTEPTSTVFTVNNGQAVNTSGETYIAFLFASQDGISKVFSVTKSSGSNADVNCGFSSGARFVMLKRTDSTGDWYVWDTERGIVAGNDPYLLLNSTAAENTSTDYIDPLSTGFTIVDGGLADGDYIGLAIA